VQVALGVDEKEEAVVELGVAFLRRPFVVVGFVFIRTLLGDRCKVFLE
jgi:hypothetical protein